MHCPKKHKSSLSCGCISADADSLALCYERAAPAIHISVHQDSLDAFNTFQRTLSKRGFAVEVRSAEFASEGAAHFRGGQVPHIPNHNTLDN